MTKRKKFKQGDSLSTIEALYNWIQLGGWVYINHKAYHPLWVKNLSIAQLERFSLKRAVPTENTK